MSTSESQSNNDSQMHSNAQQHDAKDDLPETGGKESNSTGLLSSVAAMLAGLGLVRNSRKNKKDKKNKGSEQ
ncbi:LPXTG cell wall anchor domain-containing protein [Staphylococcus haemolyticus]|nr:LPXTG cell wall anchor domain-containing protein [Staphylococcus haemolyticus]MBF2774898.1 LPXTG cell wall anchor domain-containing protein [Staphylococcus haemolyticus]MBF2777177.1 LPXTG cell wall anchor domain-containing protein [Staphylococcus haemolyticus]MBF2816632.1 LPXTG cell wall anchor domain-containing protein [Staphylococcus haemolyticus]MBF9719965.1 LPXTG cell wall anchor domain-containing protein [Staphylococcus haemolyticus]